LDELSLIRRSQEGDWDAFRLLLEQHRHMLVRTAYLTTRDREAAQDVVQEALIQIWRSLPSYRPYGSFKAWMITILINQARRYYRRNRIETIPLEEVGEIWAISDNPENLAMQQDEAQRLRRALGLLSTDHREVLTLRYYADLSIPEIARALGCRQGTVKSRLNRAIGRLKDVFRDEHYLPGEVSHEL